MKGACLCGGVTIQVAGPVEAPSACHCATCRRWSGAATWGFEASARDVRVAGEVATYRSSSFAERAWCPSCGTHLWFREDGRGYELVPGLFDEAASAPLAREVYADCAFACVRLAGDHERVLQEEYEARFPCRGGGMSPERGAWQGPPGTVRWGHPLCTPRTPPVCTRVADAGLRWAQSVSIADTFGR